MITGSIKGLLQIKFKARHDSFTDQFNRIFMVKMAMVSSMLLGLNWFKDTITCIIPGTAGIDKGYVHQACWIQGFYVFKELKQTPGIMGYYGIPRQLSHDGMYSTGELCEVSPINPKCIPMTKTFYLQYQWFPFYIAVIGFLFYLPYILFRYINTDLISLKATIKALEVDTDAIVKNYFNYQINPPMRMRLRLVSNLFCKLCYLLSNVIAFTATDSLINGDFRTYGTEWVNWSKQSNPKAYDYTRRRERFKPGEVLLPTFGFCEVLELGKDIKHTLFNTHKFVCEISQNVLYQYVLIVLWFLFILGMVISCIGFISQLVDHLITITCFLSQGSQAKRVYQSLTLRECEYLEYIRKKDMLVYGKLIRKLKEERLDRYQGNNVYAPEHHKMNPYDTSQKLLNEQPANL
jgi:hypothetical protein